MSVKKKVFFDIGNTLFLTGLAFLEGDLSERTEKRFGLKCSYKAVHLDAVCKREKLETT